MQPSMTSAKPYLIRAIHEWIIDNGLTPYLNVDTSSPRVDVPQEYIKDNSVTLDISHTATEGLVIDNETVTFQARFDSAPEEIYIPISAVMAIFAPENSQGMAFPKDEYPDDPFDESDLEGPSQTPVSPFKVISGGKDS